MFIQNRQKKWLENGKKHPSLLLFTIQIIQFSEFWVMMIKVIFLSFPLSCLCTPSTHVCMHKFTMSLHAKPHTSGYMNWVFSCNMTPALWAEWPGYFMCYCSDTREGEPVWHSGKALGWQAERPRFDIASALRSLQKSCGLWTLSGDSVSHYLLKH